MDNITPKNSSILRPSSRLSELCPRCLVHLLQGQEEEVPAFYARVDEHTNMPVTPNPDPLAQGLVVFYTKGFRTNQYGILDDAQILSGNRLPADTVHEIYHPTKSFYSKSDGGIEPELCISRQGIESNRVLQYHNEGWFHLLQDDEFAQFIEGYEALDEQFRPTPAEELQRTTEDLIRLGYLFKHYQNIQSLFL